MADLREKLKEPFQQLTKEKESLLEGGWEQLDKHKQAIESWPKNKIRLQKDIVSPLKKWISQLRLILLPLPNMKKYLKEKRRLLRVKHPFIFSWNGFAKSFKLFILSSLNLFRILFILGIYLSILLLIVFGFLKLIDVIRGA